MLRDNESFQFIWTDLSHSYAGTKKLSSEKALQPCYGRVESGTITAILGPSGAGKSTLLNCLTGSIEGRTSGKCFIRTPHHLVRQLKRSRIAYVPQTNDFLTMFTVRETLLFASRLINVDWTHEQHMDRILSLLKAIDLSSEVDWPLYKLSGGQMKRTAIASELIAEPAVLLLDEPTSGLDADNAYRLIDLVKSQVSDVTQSTRPAVLLTIHCPSHEIFSSFDQVYILAAGGLNIYQGPSSQAVDYFKSFGCERVRGNPAESCVEIATGKFGVSIFTSMAMEARSTNGSFASRFDAKDIELSSLDKPRASPYLQTWLLICRLLSYYFIKLPQAWAKAIIIAYTLNIALVYFDEPLGQDALCWSKRNKFNITETSIFTMKLHIDLTGRMHELRQVATYFMFFLYTPTYIVLIAGVLLAISHKPVYSREVINAWYSKSCFFYSKVITEAIVRIFCLTPAVMGLFYFSGASVDLWRVLLVTLSCLLFTSIWEHFVFAMGLIVRGKNQNFIGWILLFFIIETCCLDFLVAERHVNRYVAFLKQLMPLNNAYGSLIIAFYGFDRCSTNFASVGSSIVSLKESPADLMNRFWYTINATREQMINLFDVLDVDDEVAGDLYDGVSVRVGPQKLFTDRQGSYILEFFDYQDKNIVRQVCVLSAWLFLSLMILWYAVRRNLSR